MTRVLIAALFHETHTFLDEVTRADATRVRRGTAVLARKGDASTVDGVLQVAEREGWEIVPTLDVSATPSGTLDHGIFEAFWTEFEAAARPALAAGVDALWFALHGAMVTTESDDPEGEFLESVRALPGAANLPLFGVFDLHATFTDRMARNADCLVAYRENPHRDSFEAAVLSANLLARSLASGVRPRMVNRTLPIVWPPTGTGTADPPMRDMNLIARRIEASDPAVWAVNVVAGFAFADTADTGVSVQVVTTAPEAAGPHLDALSAIATAHREAGVPREWDLEAAIDDALARKLDGPVALVEPADNVGGGAPGDCTTILRAFLERGLERSAVIIADAKAVAALADVAPGGRRTITLGGTSSLDPGPVTIEVEVISRSDGRFTLEDRQSHLAGMSGIHIAMGPSVTVRAGPVTILINSLKTPPMDLGQLRSQGIAPESLAFIGVKAAVAHRRVYDPIVAASYWVRTPGPCPSDLTTLPYRRVRRPVFPLDPPWRP
jgi:microcystin degradation protein MlrC